MPKIIYVDVAKCSGCYNCQIACKDEHVGNDWAPYSKPQPEIGQFWCKLEEFVCGTKPKVKIHYIPKFCNHCENPACQNVCPNDAISRSEDGFVIIEPEKCKGCKACQEACPYNAIYFNDELNIAQKCTGCAHLLDNGYALPRCVESCPTDALQFGEKEEMASLINGAAVLKPETGLGPQIYYRNIPGKFIAATVYDPTIDEVIIGAKCRLTCGGKHYELLTDGFGDFWFEDLPVGIYDLIITAPGYKLKKIEQINTKECQNLGYIALDK